MVIANFSGFYYDYSAFFCKFPQVGRLPFLPSSNFQLDVLTGRDMEMDFDDFLNPEEFREVQAQPHVVMEKFPLKPFF